MTMLPDAARIAARVGILATLVAPAGLAQRTPPAPPPPPPATAPDAPDWPQPPRFAFAPGATRGYLGVTPRTSSGPADTLGLLIEDVDESLPAAKAGITSGSRLVSIDGIDLRLDPADLGDSAAEALPEARLRRALGNHKPGEEVSIVIRRDGRTETKRVALAESPMARSFRTIAQGRRVLGIGFSDRGSMRDTAGLLITSLTRGGAAEKAGLLEGDRVIAIDGVDLRVPPADAGSADGVQARIARLRRTLDATRDSAPVRLEVRSEGRRRTVELTPSWSSGITIDVDRLRGMADDLRMNLRTRVELDDETRDEAARAGAEARREMAESQREVREAQRGIAQAQREVARERAAAEREAARELAEGQREAAREYARSSRDYDLDIRRDGDGPIRGTITGHTDGATLTVGGLSLAVVDSDFARQFGRGAEEGALIVRAHRDWEPLRAGDMLLTIERRSVRRGTSLEISVDRSRDQAVEVLRGGRRITLLVPAVR
ncbi:MAG: PDZ domain-containing protein [Gemmatimonadaceae bacterium]|nr:PDZ domain-containing protein [Gemmatimonadaceae bacterium]